MDWKIFFFDIRVIIYTIPALKKANFLDVFRHFSFIFRRQKLMFFEFEKLRTDVEKHRKRRKTSKKLAFLWAGIVQILTQISKKNYLVWPNWFNSIFLDIAFVPKKICLITCLKSNI